MLSAIVAIDNNSAIGKDNELIYSYKKDMDRFIQKTKGKVVIMGYNTWVSLKRPFLSGRDNVVVIRDKETMPLDLKKALADPNNEENLSWITENELIDSIYGMRTLDEEYIIMGGAYLYNLMYPYLDTLYLSIFDRETEGADTFFPTINWDRWDFTYSYEPEPGVLFLDMHRN